MQPNGSEFLPSELLEHLWNASRPPPGNGTDVVTRQLLLDLVDQLNHTPFPTRNVVSVPAERQFVLPCWIQLIYAFLFGGMVLVAAVGNATVAWIVLAHRRMRTVTNYFLVNLSVADFLTSVFNAVFNLVYMLESHWAFGEHYCVFSNFVANLTVASSAFTMAAMSIDRYFAIVRPLCARLPRWLAIGVICAIWTASSLLSLPPLLYSQTRSYRYVDSSVRTVCMLVWPDGPAHVSYSDYVYNVFFLVLTYVVPVVTMGVTYSCMSTVLWGSRCIGESTERQQNALKAKQKVVRMLITVVTLFTVCWLPYHVYFLYVSYNPHVAYQDHIQHVYLAMYWLAMSHAMYNPVVYYWMNKRFRSYFRKVLCCCLPQTEEHKVLSTNGRLAFFQTSWTERQHTLRVSMCSHAVTALRDRNVNANDFCRDTSVV